MTPGPKLAVWCQHCTSTILAAPFVRLTTESEHVSHRRRCRGRELATSEWQRQIIWHWQRGPGLQHYAEGQRGAIWTSSCNQCFAAGCAETDDADAQVPHRATEQIGFTGCAVSCMNRLLEKPFSAKKLWGINKNAQDLKKGSIWNISKWLLKHFSFILLSAICTDKSGNSIKLLHVALYSTFYLVMHVCIT